jgi:hypothetical protein
MHWDKAPGTRQTRLGGHQSRSGRCGGKVPNSAGYRTLVAQPEVSYFIITASSLQRNSPRSILMLSSPLTTNFELNEIPLNMLNILKFLITDRRSYIIDHSKILRSMSSHQWRSKSHINCDLRLSHVCNQTIKY